MLEKMALLNEKRICDNKVKKFLLHNDAGIFISFKMTESVSLKSIKAAPATLFFD